MTRNLLVLTSASAAMMEGAIRPFLDELVIGGVVSRYTVVCDGEVALSSSDGTDGPYDAVLVHGRIDARSHLALAGLACPYALVFDGSMLTSFAAPWGTLSDRHAMLALTIGATRVWETRPGLLDTFATLADYPLAPAVANDHAAAPDASRAALRTALGRGLFCLLPPASLLEHTREALFVALDKIARGYGVPIALATSDNSPVATWIRNLTNFGHMSPTRLHAVCSRVRGMLGIVPHDPSAFPTMDLVSSAITSDLGDMLRGQGLPHVAVNRLLDRRQGNATWFTALERLFQEDPVNAFQPAPTDGGGVIDITRFATDCLEPSRTGAPFTLSLFRTLRDFTDPPNAASLFVVAPPLPPYVKRPPILARPPAESAPPPSPGRAVDPAHYRPLFVGRLPSRSQSHPILERLKQQVKATEQFLSERGL